MLSTSGATVPIQISDLHVAFEHCYRFDSKNCMVCVDQRAFCLLCANVCACSCVIGYVRADYLLKSVKINYSCFVVVKKTKHATK